MIYDSSQVSLAYLLLSLYPSQRSPTSVWSKRALGPRHGPTVGSWEEAVSYERGGSCMSRKREPGARPTIRSESWPFSRILVSCSRPEFGLDFLRCVPYATLRFGSRVSAEILDAGNRSISANRPISALPDRSCGVLLGRIGLSK